MNVDSSFAALASARSSRPRLQGGHALLSFPWAPGQYICEISTFHGITAAFLGRLADAAALPCPVVSIDSFESPYLLGLPDPSSIYRTTVETRGLLGRRNLLVAQRSSEAAAQMAEGVGLLLVDGGHEYETCGEDLRLYAPKVASRGVLAPDDTWEGYDGILRARDEFPWQHRGFVLETKLEKIELYRREL